MARWQWAGEELACKPDVALERWVNNGELDNRELWRERIDRLE